MKIPTDAHDEFAVAFDVATLSALHAIEAALAALSHNDTYALMALFQLHGEKRSPSGWVSQRQLKALSNLELVESPWRGGGHRLTPRGVELAEQLLWIRAWQQMIGEA